jgi:hypothetical protein
MPHNAILVSYRRVNLSRTQSHTLWKDRCVSTHAPSNDNSEKSSARTGETARQRVEMAYAYGPHMLAHNQIGQDHIPDSTLLSYVEERMLELHTDGPANCLPVM